MTALSDGSFETGVFQDNLFLTYDSAAITSRTNGTNIDLVISDVYARTGANALRITVGGAGGAKRAGLAIPIQPGQYGNCEFYYKKAGAQTGTMYTTHTFARLETDGNGVPVVKKLMWPPCANNEIVFAADPVDWTKNTSQKTTNVRAPAWATHYVVEIALDGVNAGDLYFDDFVMTVQ
jgi:hypothetical protein